MSVRIGYVHAPGGCGEFLWSMGEGVPLALARCCVRTVLSVLGVVGVGDELGVGRGLY